ncbi:P-loop NTPase fold protein [Solirubrobacter phytolaccae]|uniref:P-loop NTPase fold protein n=1 Tax=Solirubrobacter phytolaccae TaxID=1404360 RepID=A0A9X3S5M5_9ACTN|nr:P-loop NTPase fold protein [Solirubrobacter phytolaccae]MDA0179089.1 P-loop NTPase fold protein [Solirubrobacter phytolaccae]
MDRDRFSASVRRVADRFEYEPIRASELADALLQLHPDEYGAELLTAPLDEPGVDRTFEDWLNRCEQILAAPEVIDGRLVLLALGRLDERVGTTLRRSGIEARLRPAGALTPWAQRRTVRGYRQRAVIVRVRVAAYTDDALLTFGDGAVQRWSLAGELLESLPTPRGDVYECGVASDGTIVALMDSGDIVEVPTGRVIAHHENAAYAVFGGTQIATIERGGATYVHRVTTGAPLAGPIPSRYGAALGPEGLRMAYPDGRVIAMRRLDMTPPGELDRSYPGGEPEACRFSPDGERIAVVLRDGNVAVGDAAGAVWDTYSGPVDDCAFSADGTLLITAGLNGVQAIDVVAGVLRGEPTASTGADTLVFTGPDGLVATSNRDGVTIWEPITSSSMLAAVSPDSADGIDRLNITADANALADVIAAKSTVPPLSIGLFADWGSGKSFLIRKVQERVRVLSKQGTATHCSHVRNVEFNAWHFADANLWASLATHILDALAKPEPGGDEQTAAAQLARLEERLAAESATGKRLERAHQKAVAADARRKLAVWAWGLATGRDGAKTLANLKDAGGRVRLAAGALILVAAVLAILVAVFGLDKLVAAIPALVAGAGFFAAADKRLASLLTRAGPETPIEEVASGKAKAEAEAAKEREANLRQEYEDLAHGRALARYAAQRGAAGDYRAQLGLISRIHDDFERMTELLLAHGDEDDEDDAELPRIDRVVLYIDDLDRCSPKRVVEVLEAVHLILALRLFVVVIAVDPRWLLQSLKLHYAELLATDDEPAWESTPLAYLEKIIQIPFALRPMGADGTAALVSSLLPVYETSPGDDVIEVPGTPSAEAVSPGTTGDRAATPAPMSAPAVPATAPAPAFNPRALVLTEGERDFAAFVACELRTPRAVKKLTNIYRLVRARLDEDSDDFATFLEGSGADIPDHQAVLILLTVIIAHPERAADLLLALDNPRVAWSPRQVGGELGDFLNRATAQAANGTTTSTEPFRRWAHELARYSFEAGQEVYARR